MTRRLFALLPALAAASPAVAQDGGEVRFCPQRPTLGASACTTRPTQIHAEVSAVDWTLTRNRTEREDALLYADTVLRIGFGETSELQLGWTTAGTTRTRELTGGQVSSATRVGDVTLGWRQALSRPDGGGLSYGFQPFVTLPVGRQPVGMGDWGAGVVLPVTYDLSKSLNLQFTGEVDAAVDQDGEGRHLAYSGILGLARTLGAQVTVAGELMVARDRDPAEPTTKWMAAGSVAWQPGERWEVDLLAVAGLNRDAPDLRLVLGGVVLIGQPPK